MGKNSQKVAQGWDKWDDEKKSKYVGGLKTIYPAEHPYSQFQNQSGSKTTTPVDKEALNKVVQDLEGSVSSHQPKTLDGYIYGDIKDRGFDPDDLEWALNELDGENGDPIAKFISDLENPHLLQLIYDYDSQNSIYVAEAILCNDWSSPEMIQGSIDVLDGQYPDDFMEELITKRITRAQELKLDKVAEVLKENLSFLKENS